nr:MAG TPA: Plasmid recombination enzyme [Bacteriophage sp.]
MNDRKIRDNGAEACIHFKKAEQIAFYHNSREAFLPETSHEELRQKNECDKTAEEARALFEELSAKADENFLKNTGRRTNMKAENKLWESVLNLRERHTMADVQRLNARIQEITGFIPIQTAIHRDEGHIDEKTGDFIQNVHAQTTWLTQDPETGKSLAYLLFDKKDIYRKIQDIVAEELGMTRGKPAEITGARHFKNMRDYKQMKRSESKLNKEWEQKLEKNNQEWEARKAEWEQKLAEREARREEWERKLPEIMARKEKYSQFICDKIDWEQAKTGKMLAREMQILGMNFAGIANPQGNIIVEAQKSAIRNIFYMLGATAQLAVFMFNKTLINDEKIKSDAKIYNVEATLLRAVDYIANSDRANGEELKKLIQRKLMLIPEEKREELFLYALENAPTPELKADIKALIEGRFSDIAKSEAAQKRIENRDLRQALKEYSEEIRKIRDELRELDEENRILNLAEREILKSKGANRSEYADQEAANKARLEELKTLKDEVKRINNELNNQKQREQKDAQTIKEQAEQIEKLTAQIAELTRANIAKQKELERELEQEKAARKTAETLDAFDIIDELEGQLKEHEEPKQPKPEPEPIAKKADNLNIFGYERYVPEPRRHKFDDYEPRRPREDDRPKYEPEPEKIEPISEEPIFRDPWQEITDAMEKWKKCESEAEKKMLSIGIYQNIEKYEKSGVPPHRQLAIDSYRSDLNYDPADAIHRERERKLETECKRQQAEMAIKYEEVKTKSVKQQEDDARQTSLKKKRKDELEFGSI